MDLIAKLPVIAAIIYNNLYKDGASPASIDLDKDWSHNYTEMIGYKDPMFTELMRLYFTIHRYIFLGKAKSCLMHFSLLNDAIITYII